MRGWACRQLRRLNVRDGAVAARQIAAFEVLYALAGAEIRKGNERGFVALIALAEPNLVAAEHILAENGRVVRGKDELGIAVQRRIVKSLHEMPHEHWMQVVVQLIHHDNVTLLQHIDPRASYPRFLSMSNSIFIVDEVKELGTHSVNSLLIAFRSLLPTCSVAS